MDYTAAAHRLYPSTDVDHSYDRHDGSSFESRYRSSPTSAPGAYGDSHIYSHSAFGASSDPYAVSQSLSSSSYGSTKSPLTPSDVSMHPQNSFLSGSKDYQPPSFDFGADHGRLSNGAGNHFSQDFDEFSSMNGLPNGVSYNQSHFGNGDRFNFPGDSRFDSNSLLSRGSNDYLRGPQQPFRNDSSMAYRDEIGYLGSNDQALGMAPVDDALQRVRIHGPMSASGDLHTFIRPHLEQYIRTPNRLAFGERTVIVMSSKVAQKSYGTEKRFLCPPPTAIMIGNSWWADVRRRGEEVKLCPPRVVVSISGEPVPPEGTIEWTGASGKSFDAGDPPAGTTYIGRCVGKQLFISEVDEKKKKVEALVKIMAPSAEDEPERVIGTFPSKPIKVISKPSKKRQSAKNLELCINHGSTISLFHRLRSQTVSTKYLCVSGSGSAFKGSDGAPLLGLDQRSRVATPSFIARTASWDPFVMYIVDVNKPSGGIDVPPPPPPQPDYPSPPPNAIPFTTNGSPIPIYYNQTVVLQCLTSGVVSPVLIIRKVDHGTTAVGGGLQEGAKGIAEHFCCHGEVCGDPVSQLHKVAFEVFDPNKAPTEPGTPGATGAFLSCMGEKVNTYKPIDGRTWNAGGAPSSMVDSPDPNSPVMDGMNGDYFGSSSNISAPASPSGSDYMTNDGGRVKKQKRSTSSAGAGKAIQKGRRRPSSAGSAGSRRGSTNETATSGALWQVDIGETSVWTIVGTDQVRYNFYIPPSLFDQQHPPMGTFPVPSKPVTPFPSVVKYLPPDRAAEAPKHHSSPRSMMKPHPNANKMLTLYGENFNKNDPPSVFFGTDPSPFVEVRCTEVVGCLPPPESTSAKKRPVVLVRGDGVVFPSNIFYP